MDRQAGSLPIRQHPDETDLACAFGGKPGRRKQEAEAAGGRLQKCFAGRGAERTIHADLNLLGALAQIPGRLAGVTEDDGVMRGEVGGILRRAAPVEIGLRRPDHLRRFTDLLGHQAGVAQLAPAEGDVDAFGDEIGNRVLREKIDTDAGPGGKEACGGRRRDAASEGMRAGNAQQADGGVFKAARFGLGLVIPGEDVGGPLVEAGAGFREAQRAGCSLEEGRAEALLKVLDPPGDRRLAKFEIGCGPREAASIRDAEEKAHCVNPVQERSPHAVSG